MNIVICDDHRLFSDALASVLAARNWNVVSCAVDPAHAVAAVATNQIDVCLMDLSFPEGDTGLEGIVSVHETSPETKVIVLTASSNPQLIMRAVQSGADAIAFKDDDVDRIADIMARSQEQGESSSSAASAPTLGAKQSHAESVERLATTSSGADDLLRFLTQREREVLERMTRGESGRQLAAHMEISYSTVRTHVQNILAKLGVHSRLEALAYAVEHGVGQPDP